MQPTYRGWAQAAFSQEVGEAPTPVTIGARRLMLIRRDDAIEAFDAVCPHRGAHLGFGGQLDGGFVICPFHGHRIRLGEDAGNGDGLWVAAHRTLEVGDAVYVLLDNEHDNGFPAFAERLRASHHLIAGFALEATVPPDYVIENVFDADHFKTVHGLNRRPRLAWRESDDGGLIVEGIFDTNRPLEWQDDVPPDAEGVRTRFLAHVFSPMLVASELGPPEHPAVVITAATPGPTKTTTIRVVVGLPRNSPGGPVTVDAIGSLLAGSRLAFAQDIAVWEHLDTDAPCHYVVGDGLVQEYREYCQRFAPVAV